MILWTVQPLDAWQYLERNGVLRCHEKFVDSDCWIKAYKWLMAQMTIKIGEPPEQGIFPIWAWYQWSGVKKKPDLRCASFLRPKQKGVRIEFEIDDSLVLLSDFDLWHYPLNYWYLPKNVSDCDKLYNINPSHKLISNMPETHKCIQDSWLKIFDLEWQQDEIITSLAEKSIQATLWEITMDQVTDVKLFTAR